MVNFAGRGEMIPNKDTYMEIDPSVVDKWGIPVPRFHYKFYDYEINQAKHMRATFRTILESLGGTVATPATPPQMSPGGAVIHEVGCVRMGDDPRTSVLNKYCQAHHVANVFVADGGPFVSHADKNPTHTIIALAWRTAEYLAEELKKANV